MIVDGQIHGGLAEGIGIALMEVITFDEEGNCLNGSFMDYLIPTALECPDFELGETVTPCPASPAGRKGGRRVAERRIAAGDRQRGDRRAARDTRSHPHRHAVLAGPSVGRDARTPRAAAMISGALARTAKELADQGSAFVMATVVRVQHPTSVKPGNAALVHDDGTIEGFVGGVCAQHSVRLYSLKAIESGEPLLLRILPDPAIARIRRRPTLNCERRQPRRIRRRRSSSPTRRGPSPSRTRACPAARSRSSSSPCCRLRGCCWRATRRSSRRFGGSDPSSGSRW